MEQVQRLVPEIQKKPPARRFLMRLAVTQLVPRVLIASPTEREELKAAAAKEAITLRRRELERVKQLIGKDPIRWLEEHIRRQTGIYRLFEEYAKKQKAEPVIREVITPPTGEPQILTQLPRALQKAIKDLIEELERQRRVALPAELRAELRGLRNLRNRLQSKGSRVGALAATYGLSDHPEVRMALMQADARLRELDDRIARKEEQIRQMEERERAATGVI